MTARFKKTLRASDVIARLGGDEFVVLIQDLGEARQAAAVARKILSAAIKPFMLMGRECRVTASVGMAVNLSVRQFGDEHLLDDIAAILAETGMASQLLELEITEGMVIHNPAHALTLLTAIKEMGVRLAIDDCGTGYSSLGQLKNFPIDTLKVDRSFIRDIATNSEDKAITEAIIAMGKTLSLTVVAEGVETIEQEAFLREHACDEMQGYYFSRPVPATELALLLAKHGKPAFGAID